MASQIAILSRTRTLFKTLITQSKPLTTYTFLSQNHELVAEDVSHTEPTPLPPNPATGSPLYNENWRTPIANPTYSSLLPSGLTPSFPINSMSQTLDGNGLMNNFADWMTSQRWSDIKQLFELWIRSLDKHGKPNKPDVGLYNHYLRANLMMGATAGELVDLVAQMDDFGLLPNTASFNLVLKAMFQAKENEAAEKLLQRMEQMGKESLPDDESFSMIIGMLLQTNEIDSAMKYIDKALKQGNMLSLEVFGQCVSSCVNKGRLDTLVSIIEKLKTTDQNKALYPTWGMCNLMANVALQEDNSKLAYYALEFMAKWIARGEAARPAVLLSVDEGLIVSALGTAGRTYSPTLLDASWAILRRSLREKKAPNPESFIAKMYAYSSLGNLPKAFSALHEFETAYGSSDQELHEELFSPFSSLYPLVVACSKKGFETLDMVYYQLENLSRAERPFKSVSALNCVILGCANIWDLDRAYQTFEAISASFGLSPDIHSYNALMYAFGKLKKTFEASRVFEHMLSVGVKPNAMSYTLLADAHLINRDVKAAMSAIDQMVSAGFVPSKETLKKVRRRCTREMDYESVDRVQSMANEFKYRLGGERRRDMLFNLQFTSNYA